MPSSIFTSFEYKQEEHIIIFIIFALFRGKRQARQDQYRSQTSIHRSGQYRASTSNWTDCHPSPSLPSPHITPVSIEEVKPRPKPARSMKIRHAHRLSTQTPIVNRLTHPRRLFGAVVRVDTELGRLGSLPELDLQSIVAGQEKSGVEHEARYKKEQAGEGGRAGGQEGELNHCI